MTAAGAGPVQMAIQVCLPFLLSLITLTQALAAGSKWKWAWAMGLANQLLWLVWIVASESWGLIPMNLGLWVIYYRNHWLWAGRGQRD